jgi:hypothetical protein
MLSSSQRPRFVSGLISRLKPDLDQTADGRRRRYLALFCYPACFRE